MIDGIFEANTIFDWLVDGWKNIQFCLFYSLALNEYKYFMYFSMHFKKL